MAGENWFVYLLRCADGSLYTGITTDLSRHCLALHARPASHATGLLRAAYQPKSSVEARSCHQGRDTPAEGVTDPPGRLTQKIETRDAAALSGRMVHLPLRRGSAHSPLPSRRRCSGTAHLRSQGRAGNRRTSRPARHGYGGGGRLGRSGHADHRANRRRLHCCARAEVSRDLVNAHHSLLVATMCR